MNIYLSIISNLHEQWLKDDFLVYLDKWEASVAKETPALKQKKLLSAETITGLRITGKYI